MSEFVRKTALGGYKLVPGGYSDPEMSHVIMTKAEYDGLLDQIQNAKKGGVCSSNPSGSASEIY